jgi:hypothetical protein
MPNRAHQQGRVSVKMRDPLQRGWQQKEKLKHDPEKWEPVFGKDHAQTRN